MSKVPVIPESRREEAARKIAEEFNTLSPDKKREFVDETLTVICNMNKKKLQKMFSKLFFKKGQPTTKDLETINQLITVFIHSIKPEFEYHYATMIYKAFKQPLPPGLIQKVEEVRQLEWLHFGLTKKVYDDLFKEWERQGRPDYDTFFSNIMRGNANAKSQSGKPKVQNKE